MGGLATRLEGNLIAIPDIPQPGGRWMPRQPAASRSMVGLSAAIPAGSAASSDRRGAGQPRRL